MTNTQEVRPVVVGLDDSPEGRYALHWAIDEARTRGLPIRIVVAYVWPAPPPLSPDGRPLDPPPAAAQDLLDKAVAAAGDQLGTDRVSGVLSDGRPARILLDESADADLLVVGSRARSTVASIVLGSVSSAVAAHASCPVIVARQGSDTAEQRILVGIDGSPHSEQALAFAFAEAELRGLPLDVVHCWQAVDMLDPAVWTDELVQRTVRERQEWLDEVVDRRRAEHSEVSVSTHVVEGRPAVQLSTRSRSATLLVVGSRGHGGVAGLLLGSVSQGALHHAHCAVGVVHPA